MRVGLMGGTFDPVHVGHLVLAEAAYEQLGLKEVAFLPAGQPPHKSLLAGRGSKEQRAEMVRRAIAGNPHFSLCLLEVEEERPSYTYLTLERLRRENPGTEYVFLLGEDSFWDFPIWRCPEKISAQCEIAVYRRGAEGKREEKRDLSAALSEYEERFGGRFTLIEGSPLAVSSSYLRERAKRGLSLRYYVPEAVYEYIREQGLYA